MAAVAATALSALVTLAPTPLLLFNVITVPLLIHISATTTTAAFVQRAVPILTLASTLRSLPLLLGLVKSPVGAVVFQAAFSLALTIFIVFPIIISKLLTDMGVTGSPAAAATGFGLLWAASWLVWEAVSPLGRFGIPGPLVDFPAVLYLVRVAGPTGLDFALGTVAHICSQVGDVTVTRVGTVLPTVASPHARPLITLADNDEHTTSAVAPVPRPNALVAAIGIEPHVISIRTQVIAAAILAICAIAWLPVPLSLSAALSEVTPLSVACLLAPTHQHDVDTLIRDSGPLSGHARIIVWPESALEVNSKAERDAALDAVTAKLGKAYGALVAVGVESRVDDKRRNELVMVGPGGVLGEYTKQHLFPIIESYALDHHRQPLPVWSLPIARPASVPKSDWNARNVTVSPPICLDVFHPSLLRSKSSAATPSLLIIPAAFPSLDIGLTAGLLHIRTLAVSHGTPAFVCSSTGGAGGSVAAYIDAWGRVLHLQAGGASMSVTVPVAYHGGKGRPRTAWEYLGPYGVMGLAIVLVFHVNIARMPTALSRYLRESRLWHKARLLLRASEPREPRVGTLVAVETTDSNP